MHPEKKGAMLLYLSLVCDRQPRPVVPNAAIFNTVPLAVVIPNHKLIFLLLHHSNFATVMNYNINT